MENNLETEKSLLEEHRYQLIETEKKIGESFCKTILTLSGGALVLSFAFIKNIAGKDVLISPQFLIIAWILFAISLTSVLLALYFGIFSYQEAIKQVDKSIIYIEYPEGKWAKGLPILNHTRAIYVEYPGGIWAILMPYLNGISIYSFIMG
ncbi:MAG: hypothetical protein GY718_19110 [Lentisphaerae bacterium]|nr:hypothetical protein [Lentisphaerota bacterium]